MTGLTFSVHPNTLLQAWGYFPLLVFKSCKAHFVRGGGMFWVFLLYLEEEQKTKPLSELFFFPPFSQQDQDQPRDLLGSELAVVGFMVFKFQRGLLPLTRDGSSIAV